MEDTLATRRDREAESPEPEKRLEAAFAQYQDELLGMLYYLVGNLEDARDALQETFVKCWRNRDGVLEIENLRAWIFRVALNAGRDLRSSAWRRRRRPLEDGEAALISHSASPEANATRREQLALVRRALSDLRPEEQEVFQLRQNGQMTYDEIAKTIGIPVGTVKTRMRLALAKLREVMEKK